MTTQKDDVAAYLAITIAGGGPTGFTIAPTREQAEELFADPKQRVAAENKAEEPTKGIEEREKNPLRGILDRITEIISSYYALIDVSYMSRAVFLSSISQHEIIDPLEKMGLVPLDADENKRLYALNDAALSRVLKGRDKVKRFDIGTAALPSSTLMSLVAAFDSIIADLVAALLKSRKEKLKIADRTVPLADILASDTIDDVIDRFVSEEVYELLRGSHNEQVKFIEDTFDIKIREDWRPWPSFIEIFERRNLLAHGEGEFTERYAQICAKHGKSVNIRKPGERIRLNRSYLVHAADTLFEFGVLLAFSLWRKHFRDEEEQAFVALNQVAYELIQEHRLSIARNLLRFGISLKTKGRSDSIQRMMIVNLANALKKMDKADEAEKVLASVDWTATSDYFQICVAAVSGDTEGVVSRMETVMSEAVSNEQKISKIGFREWPVFDDVRKEKAFEDEFERLFGEPLVGGPQSVEREEAAVNMDVAALPKGSGSIH